MKARYFAALLLLSSGCAEPPLTPSHPDPSAASLITARVEEQHYNRTASCTEGRCINGRPWDGIYEITFRVVDTISGPSVPSEITVRRVQHAGLTEHYALAMIVVPDGDGQFSISTANAIVEGRTCLSPEAFERSGVLLPRGSRRETIEGTEIEQLCFPVR